MNTKQRIDKRTQWAVDRIEQARAAAESLRDLCQIRLPGDVRELTPHAEWIDAAIAAIGSAAEDAGEAMIQLAHAQDLLETRNDD